MNKEDGVESYEFATPEAIEEALKIGKLSQTVFGMGCFGDRILILEGRRSSANTCWLRWSINSGSELPQHQRTRRSRQSDLR